MRLPRFARNDTFTLSLFNKSVTQLLRQEKGDRPLFIKKGDSPSSF